MAFRLTDASGGDSFAGFGSGQASPTGAGSACRSPRSEKSDAARSLNDRQIRFANHVLEGVPASRAYLLAGYQANERAAEANASRLLRNDKVAAFLNERRKAAIERASFGFSDLTRFLIDIMMTPAGQLDERSRLVQRFRRNKHGLSIEMPNKLQAAVLYAKLMGFDREKAAAPLQANEVDLEEMLVSSPALASELRATLERAEAARRENGG